MFFFYLCFLMGFFLVIFYNFHYTILLLSLEVLLLSLFLLLCLGVYGDLSYLGVFMFILVMVCMGGFSVSLLVSLSRGFGRDYWFSSFVF